MESRSYPDGVGAPFISPSARNSSFIKPYG
jgi:hypothetical protein